MDELIGLLELTRLAEARAYEEVVVDTAPTGHTLRLLGMPQTLLRIAEVLDDMQAKHRFLSESLGGRYRRDAADGLVDEIAADGRRLGALLCYDGIPTAERYQWILLTGRRREEARTRSAALRTAGSPSARSLSIASRPTPRAAAAWACEGRSSRRPRSFRARRAAPRFPTHRAPPASGAHREKPRSLSALPGLGRATERERGCSPGGRLPAGGPPETSADNWRSAPAPSPRSAALDTLLPDTVRLVLLTGKGGVGKTTCAAALALALAGGSAPRRVLVLSTDPAHSLGDVLQTPLGDEARQPAGAPDGLSAREIDAPGLLAARRERYLETVQAVFDALRGDSAFDPAFDRVVVEDLIDLAPPGIDELFGMLAIIEALGGDGRCTVVVDTAPTGHARGCRDAEAASRVHAVMAILLKYRHGDGMGTWPDPLGSPRLAQSSGPLGRARPDARVAVPGAAGCRAGDGPRARAGTAR